jgi:hypothetical protein
VTVSSTLDRDPNMVDHSYRVRLKTGTVQHVTASTAQLHGDHLAFVNSHGQLAALFVKSVVSSWKMLPEEYVSKSARLLM